MVSESVVPWREAGTASAFPPAALRQLDEAAVVWLSTVTVGGGPFPTLVWFVRDGGDILVFSGARSRKVANIRRQPRVSAHFNSDPEGQQVVVITGEASVVDGVGPATCPAYIDKYLLRIPRLGMTPEQFGRAHDTCIRLTSCEVLL